jgi:hypothetical protein
LCEEYTGRTENGWNAFIRDYFSDCGWGSTMDGVTPERGIWIEFEKDKPVKVI